jgi:hypothetical protein
MIHRFTILIHTPESLSDLHEWPSGSRVNQKKRFIPPLTCMIHPFPLQGRRR